jgi:hypothetical protein
MTICILVAFVFTPPASLRSATPGSNRNHSALTASAEVSAHLSSASCDSGFNSNASALIRFVILPSTSWFLPDGLGALACPHLRGFVLLFSADYNLGRQALVHVNTRTSATCLTVACNQLAFGNDGIRLRVLGKTRRGQVCATSDILRTTVFMPLPLISVLTRRIDMSRD